MPNRYLSIWFPFLAVDSLAKREPELKDKPFVLVATERGSMMVRSANRAAGQEGVVPGSSLADARAICPRLHHYPFDSVSLSILLRSLGEWCLRFTPVVAVDLPEGLLLNISGCTHLWGGEAAYLHSLTTRLQAGGYTIRTAVADTIGTAWAVARYGLSGTLVAPGQQATALEALPPAALRLETPVIQRMHKLGFSHIEAFSHMPRSVLRRRFGDHLLRRLAQAKGSEPEPLHPICPVAPYEERLPCLEPIRTASGIAIALKRLLESLCARLARERKGLRSSTLKAYRIDGKTEQIGIGTNRATHHPAHLFSLFEVKLPGIEPALGIELFVLEASLTEAMNDTQEALWDTTGNRNQLAELLDNIAGKIGMNAICRYLPQAHHWPERSIKASSSLDEEPEMAWPTNRPSPLHLLSVPEPIEVMVPLPDYPPSLFRHKEKVYPLIKAEGPERIEQEWWLEQGEPRDYYRVEDDSGARYWLFRLGQYEHGEPTWYLHGFFA